MTLPLHSLTCYLCRESSFRSGGGRNKGGGGDGGEGEGGGDEGFGDPNDLFQATDDEDVEGKGGSNDEEVCGGRRSMDVDGKR